MAVTDVAVTVVAMTAVAVTVVAVTAVAMTVVAMTVVVVVLVAALMRVLMVAAALVRVVVVRMPIFCDNAAPNYLGVVRIGASCGHLNSPGEKFVISSEVLQQYGLIPGKCSPLVGLNCLGNDLATIGIKQITNSRTLSTFFVAVLVNRKIEPGASKSAQFRAFHISLDA